MKAFFHTYDIVCFPSFLPNIFSTCPFSRTMFFTVYILHLSLAWNPFYSCFRTHSPNGKSCAQDYTYGMITLHMLSSRTICQSKHQPKPIICYWYVIVVLHLRYLSYNPTNKFGLIHKCELRHKICIVKSF